MTDKQKSKKLSSNPIAIKLLKAFAEQGLSDKDIQSKLAEECGYQWTLNTISRRRRALGLIKSSGETTKQDNKDFPMMEKLPYGLSNQQKAKWFRDRLQETNLYSTMKKQLDNSELQIYLEDFGALCCQFSDIVMTEFMQIDDFLKHRILIDRQLILIKSTQQEILDIKQWFIDNPPKDTDDQEKKKFRVLQSRNMSDKYGLIKSTHDRFDSLSKEIHRIYSSLCATRKDRLEELKGGKDSFLDIVASIQHSEEERDRHGKFAELTKISSEDIKKEFRQPVEFPDGEKTPIIMDGNTEFFDDNQIDFVEDEKIDEE